MMYLKTTMQYIKRWLGITNLLVTKGKTLQLQEKLPPQIVIVEIYYGITEHMLNCKLSFWSIFFLAQRLKIYSLATIKSSVLSTPLQDVKILCLGQQI